MNGKIMIHIIKNFPVSAMNGDENGNQKTAVFGGVVRGRLSSANIKRNIRVSNIMKELGNVGIRTREMPIIVGNKLIKAGVSQEFVEEAVAKLAKFGKSKAKLNEQEDEADNNDLNTTQCLFFSNDELETITNVMQKEIEKYDGDLESFKKIPLTSITSLSACTNSMISVDIALFGRMVTSEYQTNVESAVQVAHALSTHALQREDNYFTLVDDMKFNEGELTNTAIIGHKDYNSCCFYEYAAIDLNTLSENLSNVGDDENLIYEAVTAFIKAFAYVYSHTGQGSYASQVLPDMVMVEVQNSAIPTYEYINAFEEPIKAFGYKPDLVRNSVASLVDYVDKVIDNAYELPIAHRAYFSPRFAEEISPRKCEVFAKFSEMINAIKEWIKE